jgi:anti-sigma B factor antagonist
MFEGDLDLASAGLLREEIVVRRSSGATSLVIDLTRVEFIDSVGLSLLVTAFNRAREDGAELSLVLPSHLRRVFEISGLVELLDPKFEDRPSA